MDQNFTTFAFTESVKAAQEQYGSREIYANVEQQRGDQYELSVREGHFISQQNHFYMATVGENGWPYIQFRGGPNGFLKVLDHNTLAYADFRGNMQYISVGNINATQKVALILLDYAHQKRLKIWAEAEVLEAKERPDLLEKVKMPEYPAQIERLVIFHIKAFDWNCPQHINPRFTTEEIKAMAIHNPEFRQMITTDLPV